ncbi:MAG: hypothetical protein ACR2HH_06455 [Chthoniobacterales bacterium]
MKLVTTVALILGGIVSINAQEKDDQASMAGCPMMGEHGAMNARGDKGMGFSQEKTTHHFRIAADGGTIEVSSNDANDATSRAQIRQHLGHIAKMFEHGNFQIPMFVHGKMPDGATVMQQQKKNVSYKYEETVTGGLVRIRTSNPDALSGA